MASAGITLVELIVVMAIIAVLATIALPLYRSFVIRSQRTEAKEALLHLASNQEIFYIQHDTYTADLAAVGFASSQTENGLYELAILSADRQAFAATAAPSSGSGMAADTDCQVFGINSAGERSASPDPRGDCW